MKNKHCDNCAQHVQHDGHCDGSIGCDMPMDPLIRVEDDNRLDLLDRLILAVVCAIALGLLLAAVVYLI